jgi:hypothetical protein
MAFMVGLKGGTGRHGNKGFRPIHWHPQVMIHGSVMKLSNVVAMTICTAMAGRP